MSHFNVAVFSHNPEDVRRLLAPYEQEAEPGSEFAEFEEDADADIDPITGLPGYWMNPDFQFDDWVIGGRWSGYLKLKPGCTGMYDHLTQQAREEQLTNGVCDQALLNQCQIERQEDVYRDALREWEIAVEHKRRTAEERTKFAFWETPGHYLHGYETKEFFAEAMAARRTYAFISADGVWHSSGDGCCFGIDETTRKEKEAYNREFDAYLKVAEEQNLFITIVDCHA